MTVTRALARLRSRMSAASAPLNRVLIGTSTAPAWKRPSAATTHSALLKAQMATRSPGSMPEATRAAPNRRDLLDELAVRQPGLTVDDRRTLSEPIGAWQIIGTVLPTRCCGQDSSPQDDVVDGHEPGQVTAHDLGHPFHGTPSFAYENDPIS